MHEDLNRTKLAKDVVKRERSGRKNANTVPLTLPYNGQGSSDESWRRHTERKSIVVDLFQGATHLFHCSDSLGQLKSTLVCPECCNVSVTFDPFMYLSTSIPSTKPRWNDGQFAQNGAERFLGNSEEQDDNMVGLPVEITHSQDQENSTINLYDCLKLFLTTEKLGSSEKWYLICIARC